MTETAEVCEIGVVGNISDFHSEVAGSNPAPRSRDRRIGRWAQCKECATTFASFRVGTKWKQFCGVICRGRWISKHRKPPKPRRGRPGIPGPIPRRIRGSCLECQRPLRGFKSKRCRACHYAVMRAHLAKRTVEDLSATHYSPRNRYQKIRIKAVKATKSLSRRCVECGYTKHVEVAHIRAISSFDKATPVSVVNNLDNLAFLCPNHHWEFDNGHLASVLSLAQMTQSESSPSL